MGAMKALHSQGVRPEDLLRMAARIPCSVEGCKEAATTFMRQGDRAVPICDGCADKAGQWVSGKEGA